MPADFTQALGFITSLDKERKEYLLARSREGTLTQEEKEEIAKHLAKAAVREEYKQALAAFLQQRS